MSRFEAPGSESRLAANELLQTFDVGAANMLLLITAHEGTIYDPATTVQARDVAERLAKEPGVATVKTPWNSPGKVGLVSADRRHALILARLPGSATETRSRMAELSPHYTAKTGNLSIGVGSGDEVFRQVGAEAARDFVRAEMIIFPGVFLLLLLFFRSVAAAILPIAVGLFAMISTLATLRLLASVTEVSTFALNLTLVLGLGLGVDYGFFVLARFREARADGRTVSDEASYAPPIGLGDVIVGRTVSEVMESRLDGFSIGDTVLAENGWQQFAVSDGSRIRKLDPNLTHPSLILGVLGNSGFAANIGLHEVAKVASTDTVRVAAATGPVGSTVVQLARKAGARVVAIAGGPDKVAYARDVLKTDVALDHRDPGFAEALKTAAPGGIDVYFENVGGAILLAVLPLLNPQARIAICGLIAWYNLEALPAGPDQAPFVLRTILRKRIRAEGFVLTDWEDRRPAFEAVMAEWIADKSVVWKEDVVDGIENTPSAFIGMLEGHSFGKTVVRCQSALKKDPLSASKRDPLRRAA